MANSADIVGYMYKADLYCPRCIVGKTQKVWSPNEPEPMEAEAILDRLAQYLYIDRNDESSFDSGEFPKVVYGHMISRGQGDDDRCGSCGEVLGE